MRRSIRSWLLGLLFASAAHAGGISDDAILIIDPTDPQSVYLGHYYQAARGVPAANVIYLEPTAANYDAHRAFQELAVEGTAAARSIAPHVDYVIVAPVDEYFVSAPGLVTDGCATVSRFALSSVYTFSFISDTIAAGGLPSSTRNHYASASTAARAFDSQIGWSFGNPVPFPSADRYWIGAQLACTAPLGNTTEEIIALIDRSVAADATHPGGTFYYMRTTDVARSGPRDPSFASMVSALAGFGGTGLLLDQVLPTGMHDCLGIMTGWAAPDIEGGDFTILPGAFCDHLTSFAGHFGTASQTKMSRWIAKGASGSVGTVQEPCNYSGKFPHARIHVLYYQGMSLGESALRSLDFLPFQGLVYGDPLTRPFASPPVIDDPSLPTGPVAGNFEITPTATAMSGAIQGFRVTVDGRPHGDPVDPGEVIPIDTTRLDDGWHELRLIAWDTSPVRNVGRFVGSFRSDNAGRSATLTVDVPGGDPALSDLSTLLEFSASASDSPAELQLLVNERVIARAVGSDASWSVLGQTIGAGPVEARVRARYADGRGALSDPVALDVAFENAPATDPGMAAPVAYGYTRRLQNDSAVLLELPAVDLDGSALSYAVVDAPAIGTWVGSGPHRLYTPDPGSCGDVTLTFTASDGVATSNEATITIELATRPFLRGEVTGDGAVDIGDAIAILTYLFGGGPAPEPFDSGDVGADGAVDISDAIALLGYLFSGGPEPEAPFPTAACP